MSFDPILHEKADSETYFTDEEVSAVNVNVRINVSELESVQGRLFSLNIVERQGGKGVVTYVETWFAAEIASQTSPGWTV